MDWRRLGITLTAAMSAGAAGTLPTVAGAAEQAVVRIERAPSVLTIAHVSGGPAALRVHHAGSSTERDQWSADGAPLMISADGGTRIETGAGCSARNSDATLVECGRAEYGPDGFGRGPEIRAVLSAGDDQFRNLTRLNDAVNAGGGNDVLVARGAVDAGAGNDTIAATRMRSGSRLKGGSGRDRIEVTLSTQADIEGGAGNDVLSASDAARAFGGAGNDTITVGAAVEVDGGAGDDRIETGTKGLGAVSGGSGVDTVALRYTETGALVPIRVTLDNKAGDGAPGNTRGNVGANVERLIGTSERDILIGSAARNELFGMEGPDSLSGLGGNDLIVGGAAGAGSLAVLGLETIFSPDGPSFAGFPQTDPASDNDVLDGGAGADVIRGGAGHVTVTYVRRRERLRLTLDGRANDGERRERDNLATDIEGIIGGRHDDLIVGGSSANILRGGGGDDRIDGGAGDDNLDGGPGDDQLRGGGGGDLLRNGLGADTFDGGPGTDGVTYAGTAATVAASLDGKPNDGRRGEGDDVRSGVEALIGGNGGDTLRGNGTPNLLVGGPGADQLVGAAPAATASAGEPAQPGPTAGAPAGPLVPARGDRLIGGDGDDRVLGSAFADVIDVSAGNDQVDALGGADAIDAGVGDDTVKGGDGDDQITLDGAGTDRLDGSAGTDTADFGYTAVALTLSLDGVANDGPAGALTMVLLGLENLTGGQLSDVIVGDAGPNVLSGGVGNGHDQIRGGQGLDTLFGGLGNDTLDARDGAGGEVLDCGDGSDSFSADEADKPTACETPLP